MTGCSLFHKNCHSPVSYTHLQGRFYNEGANGAMYGIFATYTIAQDGSSLLCNDYYFTHEKGQDMSEVAYFHNTSGQWDTKVSEELKTLSLIHI